ncbi:hypothetical protein [Pseudoxanthomonas japonensis]
MTPAKPTERMKAWLRSKKDDFFAVAVMAGLVLLLIVAAPYCC